MTNKYIALTFLATRLIAKTENCYSNISFSFIQSPINLTTELSAGPKSVGVKRQVYTLRFLIIGTPIGS